MQSETLYAKLFAKFYDPFMYRLEKTVLLKKRKRLISGLEGKILEIGSGTGINFPYYNSNAFVIAAEPSSSMLQNATNKIAETKNNQSKKESIRAEIKPINAGIGNELLEKEIADKSMDAVVCTLVLCTVPDLDYTINFIKSKLKAGGKLVVLEHIHPKEMPFTALHDLLNPLWKIFAQGCNLNRKTDIILKNSGFKLIEENYFENTLPFYEAVFILD